MSKFAIEWDATGEKLYETGVDRAVLYKMKNSAYGDGEGWNGFTKFTESPSGAEPTKLYANNGTYITLYSTEEYAGTIEAYTYPDGFKDCNGETEVATGVTIGQQERSAFGLTYRTLIGNDTEGNSHGYKIHLVYGAKVSPSSEDHETINDSPAAATMSWSVSTTPIVVGDDYKPTATLEIDSTKVAAEKLAAFEKILYGTPASGSTEAIAGRLPLPAEVISLFGVAA